MVTVVTYLWGTQHYNYKHVQRLASSVAQWLSVPHRFLCITNLQVPHVETMHDPATEYAGRCYRRLWLFSPDAVARIGPEVLHLDLDLVICGPLDALVSRGTDFTIYRAGSIARRGYSLNPSVMWLRTGTQTDIWDAFVRAPGPLSRRANADGFWGSDQAVISYLRRDVHVDTFGDADGVVSFRRIRSEHLTAPPPGTRLVSFHGKRTPFEPEIQTAHPWILDAWRAA